MKEQESNELEALVKRIFFQSKFKPEVSSKKRISSIISRCLHELAIRDLFILSSHLAVTMLSILAMYTKLISNKTEDTKPS